MTFVKIIKIKKFTLHIPNNKYPFLLGLLKALILLKKIEEEEVDEIRDQRTNFSRIETSYLKSKSNI